MDEDVIKVKHLDGYRLFVEFKDGESGEVDISKLVRFRGILEPLRDLEFFTQVKINHECGVLEWPNGVDIDPLILYSAVTGKPIEWETDEVTEYTNPVLQDAKRLRIATKVIDAVALQIIDSQSELMAKPQLNALLCRMLPWANPETVSRRTSHWIRKRNTNPNE